MAMMELYADISTKQKYEI